MKVLVIPSWYPSEAAPTAGIFIRQQVQALSAVCDVAVLHVSQGNDPFTPRIERAGAAGSDATASSSADYAADPGAHGPARSITIARAQVGRGRAATIRALPRVGLRAFELLRLEWGTPDIIHVQALWPAATIARRISRRYNIPYVVTEHSEEYSAQSHRRLAKNPFVVRWLLRPLAHGAKRTIAVSRFLADRLAELGLTAGTPVVIGNVVPVHEPSPLPVSTPHVIAHVSVMGPAKNLPGLLQAVDLLRCARTDFVLRLVGDGEMRGDLERMVADLGIGDFVEFTGAMSEEGVREVFADAAFVVVSSLHETFSVVAAEALMCGRPVLSTRCGGPEDFVSPQVGLLVEAGSAEALAEGMDRMLDDYMNFEPHALHHYARERFSPEVIAGRVLDVYREVLGD